MMTQFLPAATSYCRVPNKFNSFSAVRSATARRSCGFSFAALWASWLAPLAGRHILSASDRRLIHDPGFFARQRHGLARTHQHFDLPRLATICSGVNVSFGIFLSVSPCLYSTGTEICGQAIKHVGETGFVLNSWAKERNAQNGLCIRLLRCFMKNHAPAESRVDKNAVYRVYSGWTLMMHVCHALSC